LFFSKLLLKNDCNYEFFPVIIIVLNSFHHVSLPHRVMRGSTQVKRSMNARSMVARHRFQTETHTVVICYRFTIMNCRGKLCTLHFALQGFFFSCQWVYTVYLKTSIVGLLAVKFSCPHFYVISKLDYFILGKLIILH